MRREPKSAMPPPTRSRRLLNKRSLPIRKLEFDSQPDPAEAYGDKKSKQVCYDCVLTDGVALFAPTLGALHFHSLLSLASSLQAVGEEEDKKKKKKKKIIPPAIAASGDADVDQQHHGRLQWRSQKFVQEQRELHVGNESEPKLAGEDEELRVEEEEEEEEDLHGWEDLSPDQIKLLRFDMEPRFGPCLGMTRKARFLRAERLGLAPPQDILTILEEYLERGEEDINQAEWEKRM